MLRKRQQLFVDIQEGTSVLLLVMAGILIGSVITVLGGWLLYGQVPQPTDTFIEAAYSAVEEADPDGYVLGVSYSPGQINIAGEHLMMFISGQHGIEQYVYGCHHKLNACSLRPLQ